MRVNLSMSNLAVALVTAIFLLFPAQANANSLRHGVIPNQSVVTPSSPVIIPQQAEIDYAIPIQRQRTAQDELSEVFASTPAVSNPHKGRKGTGDACIGPVCGLELFFASIALTFVACFVVVYIADKRYDRVQNSRRHHDKYYDSSRKRRPSNGHLDFRRNCTGTAMRTPSVRRRAA